MTNTIVTRIHNNSLGRVVDVSSIEDGKTLIKEWFKDQFNRELTEQENEMLQNELEIINDSDPDNIFCFSLGIVE